MQVEISEENHYKALLQENPKESEELISLQLTLKSENLLLEYGSQFIEFRREA